LGQQLLPQAKQSKIYSLTDKHKMEYLPTHL
jgi:hypothetical protein